MPRRIQQRAVHVIAAIEHSGTSHMGNPTYRVHFEGGTSALTETNGSVGYSATNFQPRRTEGRTPVVVTFTHAGRIANIEDVDDVALYLPLAGTTITEAQRVTPKSRVRREGGANHA